jgi:hypothetical protein
MPPSIDLQRFRDELEQLYLTEGYAHQQLTHWLADRGLVIAPPREPLSGGSKTGPYTTRGCQNAHRP